jgi:signal transduction histidine kinase
VGILNDLLNYDKIESGTLQLEVSTVNIVDLSIKAVRKFKVRAANKNINLSLKILPCRCSLFPGKYILPDPLASGAQHEPDGEDYNQSELDNAMVVGDEMRLCQVICNLVSNSLKFTPSGGSVKVSMEHLSPPDCSRPLRRPSEGSEASSRYVTCKKTQRGTVRISVKDSGAGLTPYQLSQLFTEGVQFDANKLQGGGGSGLGLSISKGIVETHNGFISAVSQGPEKGSIFMVELPLYTFKGPERKTIGVANDSPMILKCSATFTV